MLLHILPLHLKVYHMFLFDSLNPQDIINLQKMVSHCLIKLRRASILLVVILELPQSSLQVYVLYHQHLINI